MHCEAVHTVSLCTVGFVIASMFWVIIRETKYTQKTHTHKCMYYKCTVTLDSPTYACLYI